MNTLSTYSNTNRLVIYVEAITICPITNEVMISINLIIVNFNK